jgi:hypothetical protein
VDHVDLIVATRNRPEKLERMLASVPRTAGSRPINVVLVCDGDEKTFRQYGSDPRVSKSILIIDRIGSVAARNRALRDAEDAVLMATDDVVFEAGAIEAAVLAMESRFPDGDGVVGFVQTNHKVYSPTGVCLVGQKFLQRYPRKALYYPGYFHFACQEIDRLAADLRRIHVEPAARLFHAHPSTGDGAMDRTHREARVHKARDQALSKARRKAGETWGEP